VLRAAPIPRVDLAAESAKTRTVLTVGCAALVGAAIVLTTLALVESKPVVVQRAR
jgi:hypothetical protein